MNDDQAMRRDFRAKSYYIIAACAYGVVVVALLSTNITLTRRWLNEGAQLDSIASIAFTCIIISMVRVVISARGWHKLIGLVVGAPAFLFLLVIFYYYAFLRPALI